MGRGAPGQRGRGNHCQSLRAQGLRSSQKWLFLTSAGSQGQPEPFRPGVPFQGPAETRRASPCQRGFSTESPGLRASCCLLCAPGQAQGLDQVARPSGVCRTPTPPLLSPYVTLRDEGGDGEEGEQAPATWSHWSPGAGAVLLIGVRRHTRRVRRLFICVRENRCLAANAIAWALQLGGGYRLRNASKEKC